MIVIYNPCEYDSSLVLVDVPDELDIDAVEALMIASCRERDDEGGRIVGRAAVEWKAGEKPDALGEHLLPNDFFRYHYPHYGEEDATLREGRWTALTLPVAAWLLADWTARFPHADQQTELFRSEMLRRWPGSLPASERAGRLPR